MSRIIWRRRGVEWVGRLTRDGPDRFAVRKENRRGRTVWVALDLQSRRTGWYYELRSAKAAAETFK